MDNITKIVKDYLILTKENSKDISFSHISFLTNRIENKLHNLKVKKPKNKRAIDWIGTAWKWVAGTPDHHDMEIIESQMRRVLVNNNCQVIINSKFSNKINQIVKSFNDLSITKGKANNKIPENIILKLHYIDEELTNIAYAIHWAKNDIINPQLLSQEEMEAALTELDKNNFPYSTIEEAFNIATIKLATHDNDILYIIDIPMVQSESYDVLTLRTNGLSKPMIHLPYTKILYTHEITYGIKKPCKMINNIEICLYEDLIDITNTSCIPNIMKGTHATCSEMKTNSKPTVELLNEGIILINSFNGSIIQNCSDLDYNLNGTFLLRFNNCSIKINNQIFISKELSMNKKMPQTFVTKSWTSSNQNDFTIEQIQELHINNTVRIDSLHTRVQVHLWNSIIIYGLIIISITIFLYLKCKKNNSLTIVNTIQPKEEIPLAIASHSILNPNQETNKLTAKRI